MKKLYSFIIIMLLATVGIAQDGTAIVDIKPPEEIILSPFKNGFAKIVEGEKTRYINLQGETMELLGDIYMYPDILGEELPIQEYETELREHPELLPTKVWPYRNKNGVGVISPKGEILLEAEFDEVNIQYQAFWKLGKNGKVSFYLPDGTLLPFFEDIGYLDGEYFDVQQDGKWYLYSKTKKKIVTKNAYEGFDFCGGCGLKSPYVYTKKDGKWGIISWDEKVLVPFAFEHAHRAMRADNWVASFSQNGKDVIVNIPTQQVFDATSPKTCIIAGMLVTSEDGQFGAYNQEGKLVVPFAYDALDEPNANSYLGYYGDYLLAQKGHHIGVIHNEGTVALPVEYDAVSVYDDFFVAKKESQTTLWRKGEKEPLLTLDNAEISHVNEYFYSSGSDGIAVFMVKQKAYYGIYFADRRKYIEPAFYRVSVLESPLAKEGVTIQAEKQGIKTLFDTQGNKLLPMDVQDYKLFSLLFGLRDNTLLAFKTKGKWGVYDQEQGKEVIAPRYDEYFDVLDTTMQQPIIKACADGFDAIDLYDTEGNKLNDAPLNKVWPIGKQRYYLLESGADGALQYAILDAEQKAIARLRYPFVDLTGGSSCLLMVSDEGGGTGKLYDVRAKKERQRSYVFLSTLPIDVMLEEVSDDWWFYGFQSPYFGRIQSKEGVGYIDGQGEVLLPPKYARVQPFGNDYLLVSDGEKTRGGYLLSYFADKKGNRIFSENYVADDVLCDDIDFIRMGDRVPVLRNVGDDDYAVGLGNLKTGKILIPAEYGELQLSATDSSHVILKKNVKGERELFKFGIATTDGKIVFDPQFDAISSPTFGHYYEGKGEPLFPLLVEQDGKWRYIREDGTYLPVVGDRAAW